MISYFRLLFFLAVIPPLFLIYKIYKLDKIEKEPVRLLLALFFLGALMTVPAGYAENVLGNILGSIIPGGIIYSLLENFLVIALVEELFKYLVLRRLTWNNANFDYAFDAMVYAVVTSLGFAALENIMYVFSYGLEVAIIRAITSIPMHAVFGVFMGAGYAVGKMYSVQGNDSMAAVSRRRGILTAVLAHGTYDFCASSETVLSFAAFFSVVILFDVLAYRKVVKLSREDRPVDSGINTSDDEYGTR